MTPETNLAAHVAQMTVADARKLIAGPLRFGNMEQVQAIVLVDRAYKLAATGVVKPAELEGFTLGVVQAWERALSEGWLR